MANKSLNEKYNIPFLSNWKDNDGKSVTVLLINHCFGRSRVPVVAYIKNLDENEKKYFIENKIANQFVMTVAEFKRTYSEEK